MNNKFIELFGEEFLQNDNEILNNQLVCGSSEISIPSIPIELINTKDKNMVLLPKSCDINDTQIASCDIADQSTSKSKTYLFSESENTSEIESHSKNTRKNNLFIKEPERCKKNFCNPSDVLNASRKITPPESLSLIVKLDHTKISSLNLPDSQILSKKRNCKINKMKKKALKTRYSMAHEISPETNNNDFLKCLKKTSNSKKGDKLVKSRKKKKKKRETLFVLDDTLKIKKSIVVLEKTVGSNIYSREIEEKKNKTFDIFNNLSPKSNDPPDNNEEYESEEICEIKPVLDNPVYVIEKFTSDLNKLEIVKKPISIVNDGSLNIDNETLKIIDDDLPPESQESIISFKTSEKDNTLVSIVNASSSKLNEITANNLKIPEETNNDVYDGSLDTDDETLGIIDSDLPPKSQELISSSKISEKDNTLVSIVNPQSSKLKETTVKNLKTLEKINNVTYDGSLDSDDQTLEIISNDLPLKSQEPIISSKSLKIKNECVDIGENSKYQSMNCEQTTFESFVKSSNIFKKLSETVDKNDSIYEHSLIEELIIRFMDKQFINNFDFLWETPQMIYFGELLVKLIKMFNYTKNNFLKLSSCIMCIFRKAFDQKLIISEFELHQKFKIFVYMIKKLVFFYDKTFCQKWFRSEHFEYWLFVVDYFLVCDKSCIKLLKEKDHFLIGIKHFHKNRKWKYLFITQSIMKIREGKPGIFEPTNSNTFSDIENISLNDDNKEPKSKKKKLDNLIDKGANNIEKLPLVSADPTNLDPKSISISGEALPNVVNAYCNTNESNQDEKNSNKCLSVKKNSTLRVNLEVVKHSFKKPFCNEFVFHTRNILNSVLSPCAVTNENEINSSKTNNNEPSNNNDDLNINRTSIASATDNNEQLTNDTNLAMDKQIASNAYFTIGNNPQKFIVNCDPAVSPNISSFSNHFSPSMNFANMQSLAVVPNQFNQMGTSNYLPTNTQCNGSLNINNINFLPQSNATDNISSTRKQKVVRPYKRRNKLKPEIKKNANKSKVIEHTSNATNIIHPPQYNAMGSILTIGNQNVKGKINNRRRSKNSIPMINTNNKRKKADPKLIKTTNPNTETCCGSTCCKYPYSTSVSGYPTNLNSNINTDNRDRFFIGESILSALSETVSSIGPSSSDGFSNSTNSSSCAWSKTVPQCIYGSSSNFSPTITTLSSASFPTNNWLNSVSSIDPSSNANFSSCIPQNAVSPYGSLPRYPPPNYAPVNTNLSSTHFSTNYASYSMSSTLPSSNASPSSSNWARAVSPNGSSPRYPPPYSAPATRTLSSTTSSDNVWSTAESTTYPFQNNYLTNGTSSNTAPHFERPSSLDPSIGNGIGLSSSMRPLLTGTSSSIDACSHVVSSITLTSSSAISSCNDGSNSVSSCSPNFVPSNNSFLSRHLSSDNVSPKNIIPSFVPSNDSSLSNFSFRQAFTVNSQYAVAESNRNIAYPFTHMSQVTRPFFYFNKLIFIFINKMYLTKITNKYIYSNYIFLILVYMFISFINYLHIIFI